MLSPTNKHSAWHTLPIQDVLDAFDSDVARGLHEHQARLHRERYGTNELTHTVGKTCWQILGAQFRSLLVFILLVAAAASFALGDIKDAAAILAIVILNAILGFRQEYSAEKAMAALKRMAVPKSRVRRNGEVVELEAAALVPGDIVLLEAGNIVPADGRLVECAGIRTQESALTGESEGVTKRLAVVEKEQAAVADRHNMVYMGTIVTYGRGQAVITDTGMHTELGKVASLLSKTEEEASPLTQKIAHVGKSLLVIALGMIAVIALLGVLRGDSWRIVFLTAVSMAVAAVPEGLPAVVTIALALGARRMLARRALIRSLPAVETLGSVTAICTDKTGTLTQNIMTVTSIDLPDRQIHLPPYAPSGQDPVRDDPAARLLLAAAALCSDSTLAENTHPFTALGDPTENALVIAAAQTGLLKGELEALLPRVAEMPFDSDRKRMSTCHDIDPHRAAPESLRSILQALLEMHPEARGVVFAKGAMDSLLEVASAVRIGDQIHDLSNSWRSRLEDQSAQLATNGIRVLSVAVKVLDTLPGPRAANALESDLVILGMIGMMDPLRADVKEAVQTCMDAGIRPVMITGDHPAMARCIAAELNLPNSATVLTGNDVASMNETQLADAVRNTSVYARVSPEHKLRIIDALQDNGEIVSMTGDGVNDAPALKSADIGVAMGITGTDVAKEASDMILLDDRYNTIVDAVREGRVIFDNIRRFIRFILASNTGELLTMLLGPLFGMPLPLLPVQILWMNLVTDGLPALALGVEKGERDIMTRPPRNPKQPIIDLPMTKQIVWIGLLIALLSLGIGYGNGMAAAIHTPASPMHGHAVLGEASRGQTMLFTTMVLSQLCLALAMRSNRHSLFQIGLLSNRSLFLAICATVLLQCAVIYVPALQRFFTTTALSAIEIIQCVFFASLVLVVVELEKFIRKHRRKDP